MPLILLLSLLGLSPTPALAEQIGPTTVEFSTTTMPLIIGAYAHRYGVDSHVMEKVIACESQGKPWVRGDKGRSRGLVQISDIYHPEVSDAQAFDPFFSIDFLASYLAQGKGSQWTCYRMYQRGALGP